MYLPPGSRWYDVSRLLTEGVWAESAVGVVRVDTPLDMLPLHVRGGQVTPLQQPAANTKISRSNPFEFLGQYCVIIIVKA